MSPELSLVGNRGWRCGISQSGNVFHFLELVRPNDVLASAKIVYTSSQNVVTLRFPDAELEDGSLAEVEESLISLPNCGNSERSPLAFASRSAERGSSSASSPDIFPLPPCSLLFDEDFLFANKDRLPDAF